MKTVSINLYSFSELSKESQERALDKYRNINDISVDHYSGDYIREKEEELAKAGFKNATILYSGFYSQGDGASFTADLDMDYFANLFKDKYKLDYSVITGSVRRFSSRYFHENTCYITLECDDDNVDTKTLEALEADIEAIRLGICKNIYRALEESYEDLTSNEAIIATLIENDYTFEADGTMRNN